MCRIGKGQISIDYIGGAVIFFVSVLFIVTGVLNTVPEYSENVLKNRLEVRGWSLSTVLLSTPGYWEGEDDSGTEWTSHTEDLKSVGLAENSEDSVSREKVVALDKVSYTRLKNIFGTSFDFNIDFTEYMVVKTESEDVSEMDVTVPPGETYHFGSRKVDGKGFYFLVLGQDNYNVSVSEDSDFTDKDDGDIDVTINESGVVDFGEEMRQYTLDIPSSGVYESDGEMVVFKTSLQRVGRRLPPDPGEVVSIRRFSNVGNSILRMDMRLWQP